LLGIYQAFAGVTFTTNSGAPVDDITNSETVSRNGPILLQDGWLIERLQVHNRERIPERNVHARGATAKGYFRVTKDVTQYTFADFLNSVGKTTPIACRWSTVIHERGSPEFLRDPRGFAVKFYTQQGNYDVVGLNFPVFFIRDGIRFPEMIRSLKPNPKNGQQEWWRIWDYFSNFPESTHMFSWLMDDVGIPAGYNFLDGWGVHTFKWISASGKETWVRYYYQSAQGVVSLQDDEAILKYFSFATADLYDTIANGTFPKWTVYVQTLDPTKKYNITFDPLDTTKMWPFDVFPLQEVGEMVFNANVDSQYLENEQIAFSPARLVPGIEPSDEKMLQTRLFAYVDTQTYRLGVNNQMLPVNRPKCPFFDNHIDGSMNFNTGGRSADEINYFPSTINTTVQLAKPYPHETEVVSGQKIRQMIGITNDFEQPGQRFRSFDSDRQVRFAKRLAATYSGPRMNSKVLSIWLSNWQQADPNLAALIKKFLNQVREALSLERTQLTKEHIELLKFRENFFKASGSRP